MKNIIFLFASLSLSLLLIVPLEIESIYAEKYVSIQKTVDVKQSSLIDSISQLDKYSQILPDYIKSSKLIENNIGNMKIGFDWLSVETNIKFSQINDKITLEIISGDFKGSKLFLTMTETKNNSENTDLLAEFYLQRNWHMKILTSFVSDDDVKSMLNKILDELVEYTKNPTTKIIEEKKFCIFGLCF